MTGVASPAIAFLADDVVAALRLIPADEIYQSVDWSVIVLLAAMIPVGQAFQTSGAADFVAHWLAMLCQGRRSSGRWHSCAQPHSCSRFSSTTLRRRL